ncbi:MAG: Co2+/Mg2+ efflux protein ApaG [Flavobacteriaceae bacterium]|nr:Co2+/Mg2+ efflux protein ApaG [Flavobacteriaceae bacterium]
MVHQVTQGIKVSVETSFEGTFYKVGRIFYAFGYTVTIHNQSNNAVQLKSRFWKIQDALNETEVVMGDGVIGKKPVLQPGQAHTYTSGCLLQSPFGSMRGHYKMINFNTTTNFKVAIPRFDLAASFAMN